MKLVTSLTILSFILLIAHPLVGLAEWQQANGPWSGIVYELLADDSNLFATSQGGGVFLSTDNAESWTSVSEGLTNPWTISLAKSDNYLFTGTTDTYGGNGGGIYRSDNNGSSWSLASNGLTSTKIYCITVDGSHVFAGTNAGIFLSTDEGSNWSSSNTGITNNIINDILCYNSYIFAATSGDGIFQSNDNGTSWTTTNTGLTNLSIKSLISSGTNLFAATSDGVFLSIDDGTTWTAVNSGLTNLTVTDLAVTGNHLFAATYSGGVFVSDNNGASWTEVNSGIENYYMYSLETNEDTVYAGSFGVGVYKTEDFGANWTRSSDGMTGGDIRCFTETHDYFFVSTGGGGVFRSDDNGENWTNIGLDSNWVYSLTAVSDTAGGSVLLAGTMGEGIFRSTDNGDTWSSSSNGITVPLIWSLSVIPINNDDWVFAGLWGGGVAYSTDFGITWMSAGMVPGAPLITSIVHDGTFLYASSFASGVFRSSDNGTSWMPVNTGLNNQYVNILFLDDMAIYAGTLSGISKSTDNGMSWTDTSGSIGTNGVYTLIAYEDYIFAGCTSGTTEIGGIYYSIDDGTSWNVINEGLPNKNIRCLGIQGMNLFAGTYGGGLMKNPIVLPDAVQLLSPEDAAEVGSIVDFSWEECQPEVDTYWFEVSSDANFTTSEIDSTLTIPSTQIQFDESEQYWWRIKAKNAVGWGDFSETRTFTTVILPDAIQLVSPEDGADIAALVDFVWEEGQPDVDTYWFEISSDANFTTSEIDSTLTLTTTQFQFDENGEYWWRVKAHNSAGWGEFSEIRSFTTVVTGLQGNPIIPSTFALNGNYPNPFNPTTNISFDLPEESFVRLDIYNTKGQLVKTLINEVLPANYHSVIWNGTDDHNKSVVSGIYFYKLNTTNHSDIGKCVLLK